MRTLLARLLILLEGPSHNQKVDEKIFTKVDRKGQKAFDICIKPFGFKGSTLRPIEINKITQSSFHYVTQILKFKMEIDVISIT